MSIGDDEPGPELRAAAQEIASMRAGIDDLCAVMRREMGDNADPATLKMLADIENAASGLTLHEMIAEYDGQKKK